MNELKEQNEEDFDKTIMKINKFHEENLKINKKILRSLQNNTNKSLKHINSELDSLLIDFGVNFQAIIDLTQTALIILI